MSLGLASALLIQVMQRVDVHNTFNGTEPTSPTVKEYYDLQIIPVPKLDTYFSERVKSKCKKYRREQRGWL